MQVGFTTLALGPVYRRLARLLAADLERWAPRSRFVVLTDRPGEFAPHANVDSVDHRQRSMFRPYHDKRFALRAYGDADVRVYLDADCRVFGHPAFEADGNAHLTGGLWANAHWRLVDKFEAESRSETGASGRAPGRRSAVWENTARHRQQLVRAAAKAVGVELEHVTFVYEQCFCVPGEGAPLDDFIETWGVLAGFLERRGLTWGEGEAIGIAAAAVGWGVHPLASTRGWLFNDIFTRDRLDGGSPVGDREAELLHEHDSIRSQADRPSSLTRKWQMIKPLVRNPLLGAGLYVRRWRTLRSD